MGETKPRQQNEIEAMSGAPERGVLGALLVPLGQAASVLICVLAVASAVLSGNQAARWTGSILLVLMALWIAGVHTLQLRLTAWRTPAARRWQSLAGCLFLASTLALVGFTAATVAGGSPTNALFGTVWAVPFKVTIVCYSAAAMLFGAVAMRAGVLPAGAMALWAIGAIQLLCNARPGGLLLCAGLAWSGLAMWRKAGTQAAPAVEQKAVAAPGKRLLALDALRGLIMILMAIDHMRMMLMAHPLEIWDAALPHYDSAGPFLTRFATHFCAPGFFFLMGAGMVLYGEARGNAGWRQAKIAGHWMMRGLLLVVVDQLVINPVLNGRPTPMTHQVLTGLGGAMIVGALLLRLPAWPLAALGAAVVLVNQVLPSALVSWQVPLTPLVRFLLVPGQSGSWFFLYSVFAWLGVALLGMAFGRAWLARGNRVFRWALLGGLASLPLFVLVRLGNGFGNIRPIEGKGWIGFLNVVKYPPSLAFLLLTLGVLGILLFLFEKAGPALARWGKPLLVFGRTALFFYVTHIFIYKVLQIMWAGEHGLVGVSLPSMYAGWAAGLLLLYPICLLYDQFKRQTPPGSLWELF